MNKKYKVKKVKKSDYSRVLVTETLPYETPIIFSNDGLHHHVSSLHPKGNIRSFLVDTLVVGNNWQSKNSSSYTTPFLYKIRKNAHEFRRLALLHPRAQWKISEFYKKHDRLIIYYCTRSPASIRSPRRIASTYYLKSSWENIYQYKSGNVAMLQIEQIAKHSPSYFSYAGYDRLYKFFESPDYIALEKRFGHLWSLDVSKCFDSIYTHCLSWAVKDKEFTKGNKKIRSTFSEEFDGVMSYANHAETNGIVIGPEVSRIFAEIIFQAIDRRAIRKLSEQDYSFGIDYEFRRYVDDLFVFAVSEELANQVYACYSDNLVAFNLHANTPKSLRLERPFVTNKTMVVRDSSRVANEFFERFLQDDGSHRLVPKSIRSPWRLSLVFIDSVKALCGQHEVAYDEVSAYLIAVIAERVKKLVNVTGSSDLESIEAHYRDAILVILEVLYFLYGVAPSVSASYKLCTAVTVISRFSGKYLEAFRNTINQRIYELSEELLPRMSGSDTPLVENLISLEAANLVLAVKGIGAEYLLAEEVIEKLFIDKMESNYFKVIACLYYIEEHDKYAGLRQKLDAWINGKLAELSDIGADAEKAHLLLDMLSCPYVSGERKREWLIRLYKAFEKSAPSAADINVFLAESASWHWFVDWRQLDLLNSLEKKELKPAY